MKLRYALLVLMNIFNFSISLSQRTDFINTDYKNTVYCFSTNKFFINSSVNTTTLGKITASVGDISITDSILTWKNVYNCCSIAYLIVNEKDSIEFSVRKKEQPKINVHPRLNCLHGADYFHRITSLSLDSKAFKILDYDVVYQSKPDKNPLYYKNIGGRIDSFLQAKIVKAYDKTRLWITNIRIYDVENKYIFPLDYGNKIEGSYYRHNEDKNDLSSVFPLTEFILDETYERTYKNSWLNYVDDGKYTNLVEKNGFLRARYRWIDSNKLEYQHYYRNSLLYSGIYYLTETSFFKTSLNPENYETKINKSVELIQEDEWKLYDKQGKIIAKRHYLHGVLIGEIFMD